MHQRRIWAAVLAAVCLSNACGHGDDGGLGSAFASLPTAIEKQPVTSSTAQYGKTLFDRARVEVPDDAQSPGLASRVWKEFARKFSSNMAETRNYVDLPDNEEAACKYGDQGGRLPGETVGFWHSTTDAGTPRIYADECKAG